MVVHPAAGHASGTLVNALLHHVQDLSGIGGELRPGIVHRLDKGTSGVMVVAKHDKAHEELARQFARARGREGIHRAGLGRRAGGPADRLCRSDAIRTTGRRCRRAPAARDRRSRASRRRITSAASRCATSPSPPAARIRSACTSAPSAIPIVGDATYGGARARVAADLRPVLSLDRPFLHAYQARVQRIPSMDGRCSGKRRSRRTCSTCSTRSRRCKESDMTGRQSGRP